MLYQPKIGDIIAHKRHKNYRFLIARLDKNKSNEVYCVLINDHGLVFFESIIELQDIELVENMRKGE